MRKNPQRHRAFQIRLRGLFPVIAALAVVFAALRLILNPGVTVVTHLELIESARPARWPEAEAELTRLDTVSEALAAHPGPRLTPEVALRRLILSHQDEDELLTITLQLRSDRNKATEDRAFLDGMAQAFARRHT
jgi:hypothetical protein